MKKSDEKPGTSETPNPGAEKEEVRAWLRTVSQTEKWRDQHGDKAGWKTFIDHYANKWGDIQKSVNIPLIPLNLVYAYTKTEIARLYFRDPWITVNAKRVEDLGAAQIAEQIINYTWTELALKSEIKRTILEAILVGHSYIKVGYAAEFGTVESQPKEEKKGPGRPKKVKEIETSEYIKSENVFAYHVPYKDIIFDPSATFPAPHNARWMAHKIVKPIRAIKESGIYDHVDEIHTSTSAKNDPDAQLDSNEKTDKDLTGKDVKTATLWEIYDLDNMRVVTISQGCEHYLNELDYPKWLNSGFPFIQLAFNPVPGEVFPLSDIATQEGLSVEMTKIMAIWLNHLKRWNRQMIVDPDLFTPEEESKFKDSIDGALIKGNGPTQNKFFIPQYPPVAADSYQIYNEAYKIYQIISGQTPADQGGQAKVPTRTLGELRLQLQGGHARADEKVDVLEDFITEIAKKLLGIMQKQYDLPKIARIVGPESVKKKIMGILPQRPSAQPQLPGGQPNPLQQQPGAQPQGQPPQEKSIYTSDFGFSWNRQDILGDMDVDVVAGSTVPMDKESQLQILEKMVPLLPAAGITPGSPAAKAYAREIFRLVNIQSIEAIMDLVDQQGPPPPPPKMMEIQAKVKARQEESKVKIQSKLAEEKIKLQAMQQKLQVDQQKAKLDMHKNVINTILQGVRASQPQGSGEENGNGQV
jgi:hypothetical protein